jgi:CubicO group peptidase (beta-lactamase class C family)
MIDRRRFVSGVTASAVACTSFPVTSAVLPSDQLPRSLDSYFEPFVRARDFSGILLIERGKHQLLRSWGRADFAAARPHTIHTRYAAESISKMFTHAAVLALQSAGKLQMSDSLARYIPSFPRAGQITIRELVDHRAGISRDLALTGRDAIMRRTTAEVVDLVAKTENGPPGKDSSYSNNGYRILARVIELAGGGPFDDLVREMVFDPRGMTDTLFGGSPGQPMRDRATGYIPGPGWGTIRKSPPWDYSNSRGAASFYTSASDLMRFLQTVPLEPSDVEKAAGGEKSTRFRTKAGHDGFGNGFANLAYAYRGEDTRLVLMGNIQSGLFMSLQKDMRALLAGERVTPPTVMRTAELGPTERWREFVGNYELRPGAPLIIRRAGDHLEVSAGEDFHPLICVAPDRFFMRLRYASLGFPPAPARVDAVQWEEGGGGFTLKKLS